MNCGHRFNSDYQNNTTNLCQRETLLRLDHARYDTVTVNDLRLECDQEAPPEGDALTKPLVQVSMLRDHLEVSGRSVQVHPAGAKGRQET